jgi:hypothetical protein
VDPNFAKWRPNCTDQLGRDSNRVGPQCKAPFTASFACGVRKVVQQKRSDGERVHMHSRGERGAQE